MQYGKTPEQAVFAADAGTHREIKYPVYTPEAIHENQRNCAYAAETKLTGNEFGKGRYSVDDTGFETISIRSAILCSSEQFGDVGIDQEQLAFER